MTRVLSVENISKTYHLGQIGTGTLYNDLKVWWAKVRGKPNPMRWIGHVSYFNNDWETVLALNNVNFTVEQGEALGIIGRNGAGKSTILKILSRVTAPTSGKIKVNGRIASLLEVGTGFHPDLTGRENIYLNGAIQGMRRKEITRKFDEIVDFSEIEEFIDTPVKRYSSGMYVRLAFAVAAYLDSEILAVDEVLAVGDMEFQKKCLGKMDNISHGGRTILFVSHNISAISSLCTRTVWLDAGRVKQDGITTQVVNDYLHNLSQQHVSEQKMAQITRISVFDPNNPMEVTFQPSSECRIEVELLIKKLYREATISVIVQDFQNRDCIHLRTDFDGLRPTFQPGSHLITVDIESLNLEAQNYFLSIRIDDKLSLMTVDSDPVPLSVRASYEKPESIHSVVAVKRKWKWEQIGE